MDAINESFGVSPILMRLVARFLSCKDVYCLSRTCSELYRELNSLILPAFKREFKLLMLENDLDMNTFDFSKATKPDSCVFTGSVVLQAMMGVRWDNSDVDIICTAETAPYVRSLLCASSFVLNLDAYIGHYGDPRNAAYPVANRTNVHHREQYLKKSHVATILCDGEDDGLFYVLKRRANLLKFDGTPYAVRTMESDSMEFVDISLEHKGRTIDLLVGDVVYDKATEIFDYFDLTAVMNSFDGKTLFVKEPWLTFRGETRQVEKRAAQLEALLILGIEEDRGTSSHKVKGSRDRFIESREISRLVKYEKRGFDLIGISPLARHFMNKSSRVEPIKHCCSRGKNPT